MYSSCFLRVRLVERGSPHSLPLMESGKVRESVILLPHRIQEWLGLERTSKLISFQSCLPWVGGHFHYPRLFQAPSNMALDTPRGEVATASLDSI